MVNRRIQSLKTMLLMFVLSCRGTIRTDERLNISEVLERGLRFNNWFYNRQLDSLSSRIVDKSFTRDDLGNFREKVERELGKEVEFLNHIPHVFWTGKSNIYGYVRYSKFSKSERPVETIFGFDRHDNIFRFSVLAMAKEEPTAFAEYRTKTRLRLPFEGEWTVGWGGGTIN